MSLAIADMQIFRGGIYAVVAGIGLDVRERSAVEIDIVSDAGVADGMGRQLAHLGRILSKAILLGMIGSLGDHHHDEIPQLTDPQIGVELPLFATMTCRLVPDKERCLFVRRRQRRQAQKTAVAAKSL